MNVSITLSDAGAARHTVPVIDRMMDILGVLERRSAGATISELTGDLKLPRTTVYRILNTLQGHEIVRRDEDGCYRLGRRLLTLAAHVAAGAAEFDLSSLSQPFLDRLAASLGDSVKLSVADHEGVLVLAVAQGRRDYALTVTPGQRMPIHAGAAGKMLLAHMTPNEQDFWLSKPLPALTSKSIVAPKRLRLELARIRRVGWAQDRGENTSSIYAFAAPVIDSRGVVVAAVSIPFPKGTEPRRMEELRLAAIDTARAISAAQGG